MLNFFVMQFFVMIKLIISYYKDKTKSMFYSYGRKYKI